MDGSTTVDRVVIRNRRFSRKTKLLYDDGTTDDRPQPQYQPEAGTQRQLQDPSDVSEKAAWQSRSAIASQDQASLSRKIFILGLGNVGMLVAHALAGIPNRPPITLLLPHPGALTSWRRNRERLVMITHGVRDTRSDYEVELSEALEGLNSKARATYEPIHHLLVALKGPSTAVGLAKVAWRLTRESTIVFLQNGMGIIEEVNEKVFPDPATRPQYMLGIVSHGIYRNEMFEFVHAGQGAIALGLIPRESIPDNTPIRNRPAWLPSSRYLTRTLTRTPILCVTGLAPTDLVQHQLEKLAVNAVINPLSVIFDCKNGELLNSFPITRVMRLLIAEISLVIRSLPELQPLPNVELRFSPEKLEYQATSIMRTTAANHSSMWQDASRGKRTEIDYINGYIVRRGDELGIRCIVNYMVMQLVKGKQAMSEKRLLGMMPLERFKKPEDVA